MTAALPNSDPSRSELLNSASPHSHAAQPTSGKPENDEAIAQRLEASAATAAEPQAASQNEIYAEQLAIEQAHVDKVYDQLAVATESARSIEAESQAKFRTDRSDWVREEDGTAMFERDAFAYQAARRLAVLDAEHDGLVFGRLDLLDDDLRHIGRIGVRDQDYEPLVIDWRAPAAEPFYRATATNPMGVIRRRVLRCKQSTVVGIEDELLDQDADSQLPVVGEGALLASLKRARGPRMRDIVATIQAEQDEAIRAPYQGVTIISGGPGTGKTVVALHRAAYLLYTHRKRLEQGGVLVVGPSDLFMSYIERVLPGLGENSVTLRAMGQLAGDVLGFSVTRTDEAAAATLKGSLRMLPVLRRAVQEPLLDGPAAQRLRVSVKGEILTLEAPELSRIRKDVLARQRVNQARANAEAALRDALWAKLSPEIAATLDLDRELFDDIVSGQPSYELFVNAWWPMLSAEQVLARLADPEAARKFGHGQIDADEQEVLASSLAHARGYQPGNGRPRPQWSISDIALLDELAAMIGPVPAEHAEDPLLFLEAGAQVEEIVTTADRLATNREIDEDEPIDTYAHVLVDEAQDVTPMQWRMLRRRGPQASWTLVGDPAQSSYSYSQEIERAIRDLIGRAPQRNFKLTTNYRSPAEVMQLAGQVIKHAYPAADLPTPVRETGVQPKLLTTTPADLPVVLRQELSELADQVEGSLAVITATAAQPRTFELIESLDLPAQLRDRLTVITDLQAKGLEFDAVVVLSPDDIVEQAPGGVRVLYVALTRPTQRLVTIDLSSPMPGAWRESLASRPSDFE